MKLGGEEEKFFRALDKRLTPARLFSRVALPQKEDFAGYRRGNRFLFWRRQKGLFSLFALTLYGKVEKGEVKVKISYSRPLLFFYLLWCALLMVTGAAILFAEPDFAITFLLPGLALIGLSFYKPKKKKEELLLPSTVLQAKTSIK